MVGRNARYEIDIMIIQALEEEPQSRYTDLREKINSRCQGLGLKKPSNDAFCSRLTNLCDKDVLDKKRGMYGCTHYSLKNHHYITYLEKTLSSHKKCGYVYSIYIKSNYDPPIETIEESSEDNQT
jgi:hypothetical protein